VIRALDQVEMESGREAGKKMSATCKDAQGVGPVGAKNMNPMIEIY
jgi:hypothetical protein